MIREAEGRAFAPYAVVVAVLVALAALVASAASGDEAARREYPPLTDSTTRSQTEAARRRADARARAREGQDARREREASRSAFSGQSRAQVAELLHTKFEEIVDAPPYKPLALHGDAEVVRYQGELGALVRGDDGRK